MSALASLVRAYERLPNAPRVRVFDGEDRLPCFAERRRLTGGAADRPPRGRGQEEGPAADAGSCVFQEAGHHAAFILSLGQYRVRSWRFG